MINKLKPKSEFSRNVLTLMTGTTIAQAIPIAISPILTRIYTPEDFGVFALYMALVSIFGSIINGRYELAIMLPNNDEEAINVFALALIINIIISIVLLFLVVFFHNYILILLQNEAIGIWLYFVPLSVFFIGLFNILNYFNNRQKRYKDIANVVILKSLILASVQLSIGFIKQGVSGLISGQILSMLFANMKLLKNIKQDKVLLSKITRKKILCMAKRYINFPKFSLWAIFANTLSQQLINILISMLYNIHTLGLYALVQRVLLIPSSLIGNSIGQVFFQEATIEKQKTKKSVYLFKHTMQKLFLIGIPIFGILFFIVEDVFAFVFGEKWRLAGEYAQILLPFFFVRFISSTMSVVLVIFEKQKVELIINIILIIMSLFLVILFHEFEKFLYAYSITMSLLYSIFLGYYYFLAKGV